MDSFVSTRSFQRCLPIFLVALHLFPLSHCFGSGSTPRLNLITPRGVQRGHEHTLRFSGQRLNDTQEVFLYDSGVEVLEVKQVDVNNIDVLIRVASDCRPGEHIAQLRTLRGISDFRSFYVGVLPELSESEPNNSLEQCQTVELDRTINGVVSNEDMDVYRVQCQKGQRLSVEIEAIRLGFMFDPFIAILDSKNFELAISDDSVFGKQDGVLSVLIPDDGDYFVVVREASFGGNDNCRYRLHVGQFPRPTVAYPAGGPAGQNLKIQYLGDALGTIEQDLIIDKARQFRSGLFVNDDKGMSPSPVVFRISELNNHFESEPNNDRKNIEDAFPSPCALNGIIASPGDFDYFKFAAKKGQVFDIEVFARRIRSGLDPVINVYDANGKHIVGDDDARRPDCYLRFNVPADGEYFLRIRDHLNRGRADFVYRVEIDNVKPELTVSIPRVDRYSQLRQKICVAKGNRFATMLIANRKNFGGAIDLLEADWPEGVSVEFKPMMANLNLMPVVFTADEQAQTSGKLVELKARHADAARNITGGFNLTADFALGPPNNARFFASDVDRLACAVTERLPFRIEIVQPTVPIVRNGVMNLKIIAHRDEGFDDPINIQFPFRPPGLGTKPQIQMKKGETVAYYPLNANAVPSSANGQFT